MPILNMIYWATWGGGWWKPWANTLAYYPLTSTTTVNDESGNSLNLTNSNTQFWTYNWVDCAYFNGTNAGLRQDTLTTSYIWTTFTWSAFICPYSTWDIAVSTMSNVGTKSQIVLQVNKSRNKFAYNLGDWSNWIDIDYSSTVSANTWYHLVITHDSSNNVIGYLNWNQVVASTWWVWQTTTNFWIWCYVYSNNEIYYGKGYVSNVVLENKVWSAQEVSDYYDQTKSNYWIS